MHTLLKAITATNAPFRVTGDRTQFTSATFFPIKSFGSDGLPSYNTNLTYIGLESGRMHVTVPTGSFFNWTLQPKMNAEDLSNFWVNGTNGDGMYVVWY